MRACEDVVVRRDGGFEGISRYSWMNFEVGGERVGKARVCVFGDTLVINSLVIYPGFEGRGYGRRVVERFKGSYRVIIADRVRSEACGFWERMGFECDGEGNYVWTGW